MKNVRLWVVEIKDKFDGGLWNRRIVEADSVEKAMRKALPKRNRLVALEVTKVELTAETN